MARSRNIKPGFFSNEDLVELGFATRLLFAGLWTIADREGRLEDRPKKIKIGVFPADDVDVDGMLQELHNSKFIQRYEVEGGKFIQILAWSKHQNPHHTEKASEIPSSNGELTVKQPLKTGDSRKQDGGNLADSLFTDSLIPDSLMLDTVAKATGGAAATVPARITDPQEIIFGYGLGMLTSAGNTDKAARSFLGGLRKMHGDEALVNSLRECARAKPLQPLEWLAAALPPPSAGRKAVGPNKQEALEQRNRSIGEAWASKED